MGFFRRMTRTVFALLLNDLYFSQAFLSPPHFGSGALACSLPCQDALFDAPDAMSWARVRRTVSLDPTPFSELARRIPVGQFDAFATSLSLSSYGYVLL
jgi:hypothetical protein